jgi:uncharacterized protein YprB with RNaseH-like and TPR domain
MLRHTFIHIHGIGTKTERNLWQRGIYTWEDFLHYEGTLISLRRDPIVRMEMENSIVNYHNIDFFTERLASSHLWRLFDDFKNRGVYLDIETSGDCLGADEITVIGLYDGRNIYNFVNGQNLAEFEMIIASYDLLITFNGSSFDLPFIKRFFPNISFPTAHIDLRFFLNKLGYRGGLKAIEKEFGLSRDPDIDGMNGLEAIRLWKDYQRGNRAALDLLIQYNNADIVNLRPLMEKGYDIMKKRLLSQ